MGMIVVYSANPADRKFRYVGAAAALLSAAPAGPVLAAPAEPDLARCIATDTAQRPWLAKTLWGLRDQEGGWIGAEIRNANGSHDLGPLQVNSWWVPRLASMTGRPAASIRYWLVHDPCFNVSAGRWIFLTALMSTGDYWAAVGAYHSQNPQSRREYAAAVARKLLQRFGRDVFALAGPTDATPRRKTD